MPSLELLWDFPSALRPLGGVEVHVWCADLDEELTKISPPSEIISADERAKASQFQSATHRRRYIAGRSLLRCLLAKYLNVNPTRLRFQYNENRKPSLALQQDCSQLQFNVSHCDELIVIAVTLARRIGIDVERIRPMTDFLSVAELILTERERFQLDSLGEEEKPIGFVKAFTHKEAYLKAVGIGLSEGLQDLEVSLSPSEPANIIRAPRGVSVGDWKLVDLTPARGFTAAVAVETQLPQVLQWRLPILTCS